MTRQSSPIQRRPMRMRQRWRKRSIAFMAFAPVPTCLPKPSLRDYGVVCGTRRVDWNTDDSAAGGVNLITVAVKHGRTATWLTHSCSVRHLRFLTRGENHTLPRAESDRVVRIELRETIPLFRWNGGRRNDCAKR